MPDACATYSVSSDSCSAHTCASCHTAKVSVPVLQRQESVPHNDADHRDEQCVPLHVSAVYRQVRAWNRAARWNAVPDDWIH